MFVLVLMVLTRTRSEDDSQVLTTQSTAEGSASTRISHPNSRHKLNSTNTRATEQPVDTEQQFVDPPKRRGPNLNLSVNRTLQDFPEGSKIPLRMDKHTICFVGTLATDFATEWNHYAQFLSDELSHMGIGTGRYENLDGKFELLRTNTIFMEYVHARLHAQWKHTRGKWSEHWKKNGRKTNPPLARSKRKSDCLIQEWNHLCDYWELEKTKKYSDKMEANRAKQVNISRGGLSVDSQSYISKDKFRDSDAA
ncbi:hypothetical protein HanXRQr2_Chr06g0245371 [Helianthus annuus]|uniref:Uncharacterized protein n=1 Tax=Helianthus annuus TaxID=4232 RepID=A0A251S400_HELAN|nr:hypothetical protein HanXRQr2_Chr06g0245371 [Helianthus annuus]